MLYCAGVAPGAGAEVPGMLIGMMLDLYKPHISGVTNYVALNKRVLEAQGHAVFVFTFGGEDYQDDEPHVIRSPGLPLSVKETGFHVGSSRVDLQACKLEYSIVSPK